MTAQVYLLTCGADEQKRITQAGYLVLISHGRKYAGYAKPIKRETLTEKVRRGFTWNEF